MVGNKNYPRVRAALREFADRVARPSTDSIESAPVNQKNRQRNIADEEVAARTGARLSRGAESSRAAREKAEQALTPAERLTLALELSDLCAELAAAGRRALKERP